MTSPLGLYAPAAIVVLVGGTAVTAVYGPILGGFITNPASAADQGIAIAENLFIDVTGAAAATKETATTVQVGPGQTFLLPALTTTVSVNAKTSGHKFSGLVYQPPPTFPPAPQVGSFPPGGPTTVTEIVPSVLYQEYNDDADIQAFVASYNALAQSYMTWFATVALGVYTSPLIIGTLLDWIAEGLYGMTRPALSSGLNRNVGPYNTWAYNTEAYNRFKILGPVDVTVTTDDIFKRIMTWNFYKGDGNVFNVRWLKRRIIRFLTAPNGTAPNISETYPISVTFGQGIIAIRINVGTRKVVGGMLFNRFQFNEFAYNVELTVFTPNPAAHFPNGPIFQEALESGVLQMPFQYSVVVEV